MEKEEALKILREDYVSFETAKLLKEKGFDVYGDGSFGSETEIHREYSPSGKIKALYSSKPHKDGYPAPTHQMALKWLREVHNIDVCVCRELNEYGECLNGYIATIYKGGIYKDTTNIAEDSTYEEATEYAIKYCLINLI